MKGSPHTDEFLGAILSAGTGLRTERRISHCYVMETAAYPRPFIITDAAVNVAPTLTDKADMNRSAVAGQADILVVPDLDSDNMLAKQLELLYAW